MHHLIHFLPAIVLVLMATQGRAATIDVSGTAASVSLSQGGDAAIALSLRNVGLDVAEIAVWQIALSVEPEPGALGAVEISSFSTPIDYLFNGLPSFGAAHVFGDELPSAFAAFSDALLEAPPGAMLNGLARAGLIDVMLTASHDAAGEFRILLPVLAGEFFDSYWIDPNQQSPFPFGNNGPNSTRDERTLAIVRIVNVPEQCGGAAALVLTGFVHSLNRRRQTQRTQQKAQFA